MQGSGQKTAALKFKKKNKKTHVQNFQAKMKDQNHT